MTAPVLEKAFAAARAESRAALVGYLPAGFPTPNDALPAFRDLVAAGCDVVEVGWPYTDPLMDGPTIQAAVDRALAAGTTASDVLHAVQQVAIAGAPAVVMSYWNVIEQYGVERFARDLAAAGGSGVITPDLPPEEGGEWLAAAARHDLAPIFLVAPTSPDERLALVGRTNRGFVYAASALGVTGARASIGDRARELVTRMRAHTALPVAVGLGVGTREQAREVASYADGVIVGSALVRALMDADTPADASAALRELVGELAAGVRGPASSASSVPGT